MDPGLPEQQSYSFINELNQQLSETGTSDTQWHVEVSTDALPLTPDGDIPLMGRSGELD